jgi:hypothetical protein
MALWRLSEAVFGAAGPDGRSAKKRLLALGRCVFYSFVAYSVLALAAGSGSGGSSSDEQSKDVTARLLGVPAGQWIVGAAGAGIVVASRRLPIRPAIACIQRLEIAEHRLD